MNVNTAVLPGNDPIASSRRRGVESLGVYDDRYTGVSGEAVRALMHVKVAVGESESAVLVSVLKEAELIQGAEVTQAARDMDMRRDFARMREALARLHSNPVQKCATNIGSRVFVSYESKAGHWTRIGAALADSRWAFRTIEGISRETGIAPADVSALLERHRSEIRIAPMLDDRGRVLYTSKRRRRTWREILWEIRVSFTRSL